MENIIVNKIAENIYTYKLKKKGRLIKLGDPKKKKQFMTTRFKEFKKTFYNKKF